MKRVIRMETSRVNNMICILHYNDKNYIRKKVTLEILRLERLIELMLESSYFSEVLIIKKKILKIPAEKKATLNIFSFKDFDIVRIWEKGWFGKWSFHFFGVSDKTMYYTQLSQFIYYD